MVNICVISSTTLLMIKALAEVVRAAENVICFLAVHVLTGSKIMNSGCPEAKSGLQSRQTIAKGMVTSKLHMKSSWCFSHNICIYRACYISCYICMIIHI